MSTLKALLRRLTGSYAKEPGSNVYKSMQLFTEEMDAVEGALETVREWRDIDKAEGTTLDRIGRNLDEPRGNKPDGVYRQYLKMKILANLSGGEAETLNNVLGVLLGDKFIRLHEGWGYPLVGEPAAVLVEHGPAADWREVADIDFQVIRRVAAAAVRVSMLAVGDMQQAYVPQQVAVTDTHVPTQFFVIPGMPMYDTGPEMHFIMPGLIIKDEGAGP